MAYEIIKTEQAADGILYYTIKQPNFFGKLFGFIPEDIVFKQFDNKVYVADNEAYVVINRQGEIQSRGSAIFTAIENYKRRF